MTSQLRYSILLLLLAAYVNAEGLENSWKCWLTSIISQIDITDTMTPDDIREMNEGNRICASMTLEDPPIEIKTLVLMVVAMRNPEMLNAMCAKLETAGSGHSISLNENQIVLQTFCESKNDVQNFKNTLCTSKNSMTVEQRNIVSGLCGLGRDSHHHSSIRIPTAWAHNSSDNCSSPLAVLITLILCLGGFVYGD